MDSTVQWAVIAGMYAFSLIGVLGIFWATWKSWNEEDQ